MSEASGEVYFQFSEKSTKSLLNIDEPFPIPTGNTGEFQDALHVLTGARDGRYFVFLVFVFVFHFSPEDVCLKVVGGIDWHSLITDPVLASILIGQVPICFCDYLSHFLIGVFVDLLLNWTSS